MDFTGYGPTGFSPSYSLPRGSSYGVAVFEIEGNAPGVMAYDPVQDVNYGERGDFTQFQVVGGETGPLATTFNSLELKEYGGFKWSDLEPGQLWLIFTGPARLKDGFPPKSKDFMAGTIKYGPNFESDLMTQLASINASLPEGLFIEIRQMDANALVLDVVPEPGTLVLLLSGGLGLLLVWRRRRRS